VIVVHLEVVRSQGLGLEAVRSQGLGLEAVRTLLLLLLLRSIT
jgi:hypothetical protein